MRPLWERTLTWSVADHLFRQGVGENAAYSTAALVVRGLDRKYGLTTLVWNSALESPADVSDSEKVPPLFLSRVQSFWRSVAGPATSKAERNRLFDLALVSLLQRGRAESAAAAQLAVDARSIESVYGKLGASGWDVAADFGSLRDELALTKSTAVVTAFDRLVAASGERKEVLKEFQIWLEALGWYTGTIDGIWGEKTETAYIHVFPWMLARMSELRDVKAIRDAIGFADAKAIAVLITRDQWLAQHPEEVVPISSAGDVDNGLIEVSYPKAGSATASTTPSGGSQVVVSYPKTSESSTPERVAITLPAASEITASIVPVSSSWRPSKNMLIGGGLVLAGGLVVTAAYLMRRRNLRALPEAA